MTMLADAHALELPGAPCGIAQLAREASIAVCTLGGLACFAFDVVVDAGKGWYRRSKPGPLGLAAVPPNPFLLKARVATQALTRGHIVQRSYACSPACVACSLFASTAVQWLSSPPSMERL